MENRKRILVVDDEQEITLVLRSGLTKHGYDVRVAGEGEAALELLRCLAFLHPDAIPDDLLERGASQLGSLVQAMVTDPFEFEIVLPDLMRAKPKDRIER